MFAWLVPSIFAYIYAVFGGIEFALPVLRIATTNKQDHGLIDRWFSPVWEVINVFLVMAITGFAAIFPLVLPILTPALRWWLLLAGLGLGFRALIVLAVFYGGSKSRRTDLVLALISLLIPVALSQIVINLMLASPAPVQMACAALVAVFISLALGSGFLLMVRPGGPYRKVTILSLVGGAVFVYPLGHIQDLVPVALATIGSVVLAIAASLSFRNRWVPLLASWFVLTMVFIRVLVRQWPYVIYGRVSYDQVAAGPAIHQAIMWGLLIGTVIVLPGLGWLVSVLIKNFSEL